MKKKYLFLLSALLVVVLSAGFTSCSDDDDDMQNVLVGTWSREDSRGTTTWTFKKGGEVVYDSPITSYTAPYTIMAWVPETRSGYVRIFLDDYKIDEEFSINGNILSFRGTIFTKK